VALAVSVGAAGCAARAVSRADAAWLKQRPDVHPQVGRPAKAQLRFVAPGARERHELAPLSSALAFPMARARHLPEVTDRQWTRVEAPPGRAGPLIDPADALVARLLDGMRARGLARARSDACRRGECEPELFLEATVEQVEISVTDRPVRPLLPVFAGRVVLMDPFGRVVWRGACELTLSARTDHRPRPLIPRTQQLLDAAAVACADRLAEELLAAVEGSAPSARREDTSDDDDR
jgi:hypothetical protein